MVKEHAMILIIVKYCPNYQIEEVQSFNIRSRYIWYYHIFAKLGYCVKKIIPYKNQCETGNKGGGVQSDPKVWVRVQSSTGTHISLVSNYDYLRMKYKYYFSSNLCVIFLQIAIKLIGHKYLLVYLGLSTYMRHLFWPKGAVKILLKPSFTTFGTFLVELKIPC